MNQPLRFSRHGLLLTILATAGLLALRYRKLLAHLAEPVCLEPYRDGIKTYINATWHARFGSSATWFEGMNYPYQEHIVAATELPGLAILLKWFTPVFPALPDYIFGITHLLLLLSILLCAVFLYLIFKELRLSVWYCVLVAIGLTFLAPQNLRFVPHLGLAPPFVIPAVIWGLLKFHQKPSWRVSGFLGLVVFVASMLHFYFFAMTVLLISGWLFFWFWQKGGAATPPAPPQGGLTPASIFNLETRLDSKIEAGVTPPASPQGELTPASIFNLETRLDSKIEAGVTPPASPQGELTPASIFNLETRLDSKIEAGVTPPAPPQGELTPASIFNLETRLDSKIEAGVTPPASPQGELTPASIFNLETRLDSKIEAGVTPPASPQGELTPASIFNLETRLDSKIEAGVTPPAPPQGELTPASIFNLETRLDSKIEAGVTPPASPQGELTPASIFNLETRLDSKIEAGVTPPASPQGELTPASIFNLETRLDSKIEAGAQPPLRGGRGGGCAAKFSLLKTLLPHYVLMVLLPLAFFLFWMILNDPVTDRSSKPWGFLVYRSKWEGMFACTELPLYQWIHNHVIKIETVQFEGWAYVGMVASAFVLVAFFRWVGRFFKKPLLDFFEPEQRRFFYPLLWTGIAMAIFSTSQPFATEGFEFLLDYLGALRQFRSTGRFAWVFYFVINVVAFAAFFRLISTWRRKAVKIFCFGLILSALTYEAWVFANNQFMFHGYEEVPELTPGKRFTDQLDLDFSKYQAIIPIPYFNVGSNNFGAPGGQTSIQQSLVLGAQSGLPVTGAMLTRSSRQQAFRQLQLVNKPYRMPAVFEDYPNDKPVLLLWSKPFNEDDEKRYGHLRQEARLLHETERWSLYEMDLAAFRQRIERRKMEVLEAKQAKKLYPVNGFLSTDSLENFLFQNFDNQPVEEIGKIERTCLGKGAWQGKVGDLSTLFSGNLPQAKTGSQWHVLAWVFVNEDRFSQTLIRIREEDEQGRKLQEKVYMPGHQAVEYDPRGWVLADCPFQITSPTSKFTVTFQLDDADDKFIQVDEMLIKPMEVDLYREGNEVLWWNNRWCDK